jgi:hypothetical protein
MMLQINKIAIPEFFTPVGQLFWNDVRMGIDFKHGLFLQSCNIGVF